MLITELARRVKAMEDLGEDVGGYRVLDLMVDNFPDIPLDFLNNEVGWSI